jgi:hypothetical protein
MKHLRRVSAGKWSGNFIAICRVKLAAEPLARWLLLIVSVDWLSFRLCHSAQALEPNVDIPYTTKVRPDELIMAVKSANSTKIM